MTHGSVSILCSLILTGKEGQEILGPEAQVDEAGCTGTLWEIPILVEQGPLCPWVLHL